MINQSRREKVGTEIFEAGPDCLGVWACLPLTGCKISSSLSFLICKREIILVSVSQSCSEVESISVKSVVENLARGKSKVY